MSYKKGCIEAFSAYVHEQEWDSKTKEIVKQVFASGFDYGSLNGASDEIKQYSVDRLKPIKNKKAKEIIEKLNSMRH